MINEKRTELIAVYARVSTARQEDEKTIDTQLLAIREFARHNNYTITQEYTDEGWSGDILARPSLDRLRTDAKKKLWDGVLAYDPDRIARRGSYQALVMDELEELGLEVLFVTTPAPKNIEDRMLYGMKGLFAEYERAKIAERTRLGKLRKAREGHIIATEAPFGYRLVRRQGKKGDPEFSETHYEIDEAEAPMARLIFSWAGDEGLSIRSVVKRLQEMNIRPRKSPRGVWSTSTLTTLLKNKTYIGEGHYGASVGAVPKKPIKPGAYKRIKKSSRKIRPEEEWIKIPTPRLIDNDLFERVQAQLLKNRVFSIRNTKNEYLLAGKIRCMCGKARGGEGALRGKHLYYRCIDRLVSFPLPRTCHERGINARVADQLVWDTIARLMSSPDLMLKQVQLWQSKLQAKQGDTVDESMLRRELEKLGDEETRYAKAYGAGLLEMGKLQELVAPIRQRAVSLEKRLASLVTNKSNELSAASMPNLDDMRAFAERAASCLANLCFSAKREIVLSVIESIVGTQDQLILYGYLPVTDYVEFETNHRDGASINRQFACDKNSSVPFEIVIKLPPPNIQTVKRSAAPHQMRSEETNSCLDVTLDVH